MQHKVDATQTRSRYLTLLLSHLCAAFIILLAFWWRSFIDSLPFEGISGCLVHDLLHIYCPLCGGTRAMIALCRGQLWTSLCYHPLAAYFAIGFLVFDGIAICRTLRRDARPALYIPKWYWLLAVLIALSVFVARNVALVGWGIDNLGDLAGYW